LQFWRDLKGLVVARGPVGELAVRSLDGSINVSRELRGLTRDDVDGEVLPA